MNLHDRFILPTLIDLGGGIKPDGRNRDIPTLLREGGFRVEDLEQLYLPGPRPMTYNDWGSASAAE